MAGRFPFKTLTKYPHMKPEDVAVWGRFIEKNRDYFETVDYDVRVGKGVEPTGDREGNVEMGYQMLTQKKIDVVGYKAGRTTLVEVKPYADMRALGQIVAYSHLYAIDHPDELPLERMVVAREVERELAAVYAAQGVGVELA